MFSSRMYNNTKTSLVKPSELVGENLSWLELSRRSTSSIEIVELSLSNIRVTSGVFPETPMPFESLAITTGFKLLSIVFSLRLRKEIGY